MSANAIDITGQKFGKLFVVKRCGSANGQALWLCRCDCGNMSTVRGYQLRHGLIYTCGKCEKNHGKITHGMTVEKEARIYRTWINMKDRCGNPKYIGYHNYGGRGITVCPEWVGKGGFERFYEWAMENGYNDALTIDRIDGEKGYCPENCKWSTTAEQSLHKRTNRIIEIGGRTQTITEWSREYGMRTDTVAYRIKHGMSAIEALTMPLRSIGRC